MTDPTPHTVSELREYALLQACFQKPYHAWTDEERDAYWRHQTRQNGLHMHPYTRVTTAMQGPPAPGATAQAHAGAWRRIWQRVCDTWQRRMRTSRGRSR